MQIREGVYYDAKENDVFILHDIRGNTIMCTSSRVETRVWSVRCFGILGELGYVFYIGEL